MKKKKKKKYIHILMIIYQEMIVQILMIMIIQILMIIYQEMIMQILMISSQFVFSFTSLLYRSLLAQHPLHFTFRQTSFPKHLKKDFGELSDDYDYESEPQSPNEDPLTTDEVDAEEEYVKRFMWFTCFQT